MSTQVLFLLIVQIVPTTNYNQLFGCFETRKFVLHIGFVFFKPDVPFPSLLYCVIDRMGQGQIFREYRTGCLLKFNQSITYALGSLGKKHEIGNEVLPQFLFWNCSCTWGQDNRIIFEKSL